MKNIKIIVEKHLDGYVAYPLGVKGVVVGQGDTYEEALSDVKSAIRFHIETFGEEVLEIDPPIIEAFVAEAGVELEYKNFLSMLPSKKSSEPSKSWASGSSGKKNMYPWNE
jgi:predicted RNase H-like HicB family nuclease